MSPAAETLGWVGVVLLLGALVLVDLRFFARHRAAGFGEAVAWTVGWTAIGLAGTSLVAGLAGAEAATSYITVYLLERSLSLDNLFVFLLVLGYFAVPPEHRGRLVVWGVVFALLLRGAAIAVGVALVDALEPVLYVFAALLVFLAVRILQGTTEDVDPSRTPLVRAVRRLFPVTDGLRGGSFLVHEDGRTMLTPLALCLAALVAVDAAFAVDSIPAAFAVTRDGLVIWLANAFALLGLRALLVVVQELVRRFRYLDETIAAILLLVAARILLQDVVEIDEATMLAAIGAVLAVGILASLAADRLAPPSEAELDARHPPRCPPPEAWLRGDLPVVRVTVPPA